MRGKKHKEWKKNPKPEKKKKKINPTIYWKIDTFSTMARDVFKNKRDAITRIIYIKVFGQGFEPWTSNIAVLYSIDQAISFRAVNSEVVSPFQPSTQDSIIC